MVYKIETRKVQKTGGSSYIVSLPKPWIEKNNIEKKDTIGIMAQPDGNLLITPKINSEDILKKKEIITDEYEDYNFLFRVLISSYIMGFSKIILKSSGGKFEPIIRNCIIDFTKITIGPEIVEETNTFILIKDLLDPKEMPFEKTIKRMYILSEGMHNDAIRALKTNDQKLADEVIARDDDIDRLHWLIGRQSNIVLRDIILSQKMGISLEEANYYQQMSRYLERIADHAVKIAKNVKIVIEKGIRAEIIDQIAKANKIATDLIDQSLEARMNKDIKMANENIEAVSNLIELCEGISIKPGENHVQASIATSYIVESIRRAGEYAGDISELIMNNLINE
ncbi:MAG: phosphate uptake regulator PhoU [Promethearchaeota archaeon]|nr:MAG: phosphate uptake regulator PhoU [Candidatus Lokiarchaeota archaeon]